MANLLTSYLLPFLLLGLGFFYIAAKVRANGGPAGLVITFLLILMGPNLAYTLIADDSSTALFGISLLAAVIVTGILAVLQFRKR